MRFLDRESVPRVPRLLLGRVQVELGGLARWLPAQSLPQRLLLPQRLSLPHFFSPRPASRPRVHLSDCGCVPWPPDAALLEPLHPSAARPRLGALRICASQRKGYYYTPCPCHSFIVFLHHIACDIASSPIPFWPPYLLVTALGPTMIVAY